MVSGSAVAKGDLPWSRLVLGPRLLRWHSQSVKCHIRHLEGVEGALCQVSRSNHGTLNRGVQGQQCLTYTLRTVASLTRRVPAWGRLLRKLVGRWSSWWCIAGLTRIFIWRRTGTWLVFRRLGRAVSGWRSCWTLVLFGRRIAILVIVWTGIVCIVRVWLFLTRAL